MDASRNLQSSRRDELCALLWILHSSHEYSEREADVIEFLKVLKLLVEKLEF